MYSGDPGLGQQCVTGRPLCFFKTRLSSCSSTGACDFVVGSTPPRPELSNSLSSWMMATFHLELDWKLTAAFAAARLQWGARACKNHDHFSLLHRMSRHGQLPHQLVVRHLMDTTRFESSRTTISPTTNHKLNYFFASQLERRIFPHDPFNEKKFLFAPHVRAVGTTSMSE